MIDRAAERAKVGVIIGRFQVDELHDGHLSLIDHVMGRHGRVVVLLGCRSAAYTSKNPLDYVTRRGMIKALYPDAIVMPVMDRYSNVIWSAGVDFALGSIWPKVEAIIYGGDGNSLDSYSGRHEIKVIDIIIDSGHAEARRAAIAEQPLTTSDFRAGVIYGMCNQRPRIELTVDIAGLHGDSMEDYRLLLGRKSDEPQLRFPGGFVDPSDQSTLMAAKREFREETGLHIEHQMTCVGDFIIDDWRVEGEPDLTHRTVLYQGWVRELPDSARAGDDLAEVEWVPLSKISEDDIVPEHRILLRALLTHLRKGNIQYDD